MGLILAIILIVTAALSWWISGYDPKLTGEDRNADLLRRIIRCALTLLLMAAGIIATRAIPQFVGFVAVVISIPMVALWMNCLSEALANVFQDLTDSPSHPSEPGPKKLMSDLDRLALLSSQGQTKEALQLCARLMKSGEGNRMAMETMCFRLYSEMFDKGSLLSNKSLAPIHSFFEHGQLKEAESRLIRIVKRNPEALPAVYLLVRLYTQNLKQPEKAGALIQSLEEKSKLPPMFAAYANHCIKHWLDPNEPDNDEGIESLLAVKRL